MLVLYLRRAYMPACTLKASHKGRNFVIRHRFRSSDRRRAALTTAAITGAALLGTTVVAASSAQASTDSNCVTWTKVKPPGVYCFGIDGSGRQVSGTFGNYYFVGLSFHPALYNEREVIRFYNKKNVNYQTFLEPAYRGWRFGSQNWTTDIHGAVRPGRVCGSLQGDGKVLATVCVGIS
jgi:hypothetical protein